jgi:hypothetical protein
VHLHERHFTRQFAQNCLLVFFLPTEKGSRCALAAVVIERFYESETSFIRERRLDAAWDPMHRVTPMTHAALVKAPQVRRA